MTGAQPYIVNDPANYLKEIRSSGVAVYHWDGWLDMFPKDGLLWYSNLTNPKKIVIGPWAHPQLGMLDLVTEELRWYDYWLKGHRQRGDERSAHLLLHHGRREKYPVGIPPGSGHCPSKSLPTIISMAQKPAA